MSGYLSCIGQSHHLSKMMSLLLVTIQICDEFLSGKITVRFIAELSKQQSLVMDTSSLGNVIYILINFCLTCLHLIITLLLLVKKSDEATTTSRIYVKTTADYCCFPCFHIRLLLSSAEIWKLKKLLKINKNASPGLVKDQTYTFLGISKPKGLLVCCCMHLHFPCCCLS